ncbi:MAG: class I SAM-dependent methyltransferase [Tannerella sp.]|jgi:hypothetical protein|nr:class I SAM-dependent methyltransferase [Tannerella sp.]
MKITERLKAFIREHADDDVLQLVLNASRYKDVDVRFAAGQIEARRRIRGKLPSWYASDCVIYPSSLAAEQCSSEQTALYKQRLIEEGDSVCDLTGGLGVDAYFLSLKAKNLTYVERNAGYCDAAAHNMEQLGAQNIRILNEDAVTLLRNNPDALSGMNVIYLDPARRGSGEKRAFAPEDCEPDLTELWPLLCGNGRKIIVKLSPMLDISSLLSQLPAIGEIHVVSVGNECRELLAVAGASRVAVADVQIYCINRTTSGREQFFHFLYGEEKAAVAAFAGEIGRYLYEPNASILKAGACKTVSSRYGLEKLHASSHLYTSNACLPSFAGRVFEVSRVYRFDNRLCRSLSAQIPRANVAVRNFPLSVDELRRRTHIADGGDIYLFASTLSGNRKILIECRKIPT